MSDEGGKEGGREGREQKSFCVRKNFYFNTSTARAAQWTASLPQEVLIVSLRSANFHFVRSCFFLTASC